MDLSQNSSDKIRLDDLKKSFMEDKMIPVKWWDFAEYLNLKYGYTPSFENFVDEIGNLPLHIYINLYLVYDKILKSLTMFPLFHQEGTFPHPSYVLQSGFKTFMDIHLGHVKDTYQPYSQNLDFKQYLKIFIKDDSCLWILSRFVETTLILDSEVPRFTSYVENLLEKDPFFQRALRGNPDWGLYENILTMIHNKFPDIDILQEIMLYYHIEYEGMTKEEFLKGT